MVHVPRHCGFGIPEVFFILWLDAEPICSSKIRRRFCTWLEECESD